MTSSKKEKVKKIKWISMSQAKNIIDTLFKGIPIKQLDEILTWFNEENKKELKSQVNLERQRIWEEACKQEDKRGYEIYDNGEQCIIIGELKKIIFGEEKKG